uniref:secreted immunoglobulin domain 1 n=1 Tax=Scatophagus argus TaxID=75038 RepID=UPI001ED86483|nr:secreted immunoglobulin domain 1 [Scatophagus argus]
MMESVLVCLMLLSAGGVVRRHDAAALLVSTMRVRVGEDATLHCPLLAASNATTNTTVPSTLSWYKRTAEQGPQMLLSIRSNDSSNVKYGSGFSPEKVSATANGSLLLHASQRSDSAIYYCGITHGDERKGKVPEK